MLPNVHAAIRGQAKECAGHFHIMRQRDARARMTRVKRTHTSRIGQHDLTARDAVAPRTSAGSPGLIARRTRDQASPLGHHATRTNASRLAGSLIMVRTRFKRALARVR